MVAFNMGAVRKLLFALSILALVALNWSEGAVILHDDDELGPDYLAHFHVDATSVVIHVVVKTTGYVGFGISPTGAMDGADIFICGVRDGTVYYADYHSNGYRLVLDTIENWELVAAKENDTHTEIEFKRLFDTKDTDHDLVIEEGPITVIWAYGATDDITRHAARGEKKITIRPMETTTIPTIVTTIPTIVTTIPTIVTTIPTIVTTIPTIVTTIPTIPSTINYAYSTPSITDATLSPSTTTTQITTTTPRTGSAVNAQFSPVLLLITVLILSS